MYIHTHIHNYPINCLSFHFSTSSYNLPASITYFFPQCTKKFLHQLHHMYVHSGTHAHTYGHERLDTERKHIKQPQKRTHDPKRNININVYKRARAHRNKYVRTRSHTHRCAHICPYHLVRLGATHHLLVPAYTTYFPSLLLFILPTEEPLIFRFKNANFLSKVLQSICVVNIRGATRPKGAHLT